MSEEIVKKRLGVFNNPWLTLMHFHVTFIPVLYAIAGAYFASQIDYLKLALASIGLFVAKYGFYLYDEATGKQWATKIPKATLIKAGSIFFVIGLLLGAYLVYLMPLFSIVYILVSFLGFAYNYRKFMNGAFHNFWNFSFTWGMLPFIGGYFLMTGSLKPSIIALGIAIACLSSIIQRFSESIKHGDEHDTVAYHARHGQLAVLYTVIFLLIATILLHFGY